MIGPGMLGIKGQADAFIGLDAQGDHVLGNVHVIVQILEKHEWRLAKDRH